LSRSTRSSLVEERRGFDNFIDLFLKGAEVERRVRSIIGDNHRVSITVISHSNENRINFQFVRDESFDVGYFERNSADRNFDSDLQSFICRHFFGAISTSPVSRSANGSVVAIASGAISVAASRAVRAASTIALNHKVFVFTSRAVTTVLRASNFVAVIYAAASFAALAVNTHGHFTAGTVEFRAGLDVCAGILNSTLGAAAVLGVFHAVKAFTEIGTLDQTAVKCWHAHIAASNGHASFAVTALSFRAFNVACSFRQANWTAV
jgi:hypothetical protein